MGYYIAVKIAPEETRHFKVPPEVYIYVKQLELCLRLGGETKEALERLYPGRFSLSGKEKENGSTSESNRSCSK